MSSRKAAGKRRGNGPWSEWVLEKVSERYYRARQRSNGTWEYQWDEEQQAAPVPRTEYASQDDATREPSSSQSYVAGENFTTKPIQNTTSYNSAASGSYEMGSGNSYRGSGNQSTQTMGSSAPFAPVATMYSSDIDNLASKMGSSSLNGPQSKPGKHIRSKNPSSKKEKLDPRFKMHKPQDFSTGTVFKTLWTEPAGGQDGYDTAVTDDESSTKFGEKIHTKIRRFVVAKEQTDQGCSLCLPILTYQGRGTNKPGIYREGHAAIFHSDGKPKFAPGEDLDIDPISVQMKSPEEKLDPMTRLNFNKVYTIEHNVKILIIGWIHANDMERFKAAWAKSILGSTPPKSNSNTYSGSTSAGYASIGAPGHMSASPYTTATAPGYSAYGTTTGAYGASNPPSTVHMGYTTPAPMYRNPNPPSGYPTSGSQTTYGGTQPFDPGYGTTTTGGPSYNSSHGYSATSMGSSSYNSSPGYGAITTGGSSYNSNPSQQQDYYEDGTPAKNSYYSAQSPQPSKPQGPQDTNSPYGQYPRYY